MSDQVPTFGVGDRVRVMATDAMVARGLANCVGVVFATWIDNGAPTSRVQFDHPSRAESVRNSGLMREIKRAGAK